MKNRKYIIPIIIVAWLISMVGAWFLVNAITNSNSNTSKYTKITPSQLDDWYNRNRSWAESNGYSKDLAEQLYITKKLREQGADFGDNPTTFDNNTLRRLYDEGFDGPNPYARQEQKKRHTPKYNKISPQNFEEYWEKNRAKYESRNWSKDLVRNAYIARELNKQGTSFPDDINSADSSTLAELYNVGYDGPNPYASTLDVIRYKIRDNITNIHVWCFSILTIIMLSVVISFLIINRKKKKRMEVCVQDELNNMTPQKQSNNKEIMKEKLTKVWSWIKQKKYYLLGYVITAAIFVIVVNICLNDKIDASLNDIKNQINEDIFESKKYIGTCGDSYTIVGYKGATLPKNTSTDTTKYAQKYGRIVAYYKATGGWEIRYFENMGDSIIERSITPYAVGMFQLHDNWYSPKRLFRDFYDSLTNTDEIDPNNAYKIDKLQNLNSKFHKINARERNIDEYERWGDYGGGRAFANWKIVKTYFVGGKIFKTGFYRVLYNGVALFVPFLLYWVVVTVLKRKKKPLKNQFNLDISLNRSTETSSNEKSVDELLTRLNPNNFMSPYDPQKVRVANDLYSALLQSRDNETIVSMIREKAKAELGIN